MKRKLLVVLLAVTIVLMSGGCMKKLNSTVTGTDVKTQSKGQVEVTQRYFETYLNYSDKPDIDMSFQFKNTGSVPVRVYSVDMIAYDANKTSLGEKSGYTFAPEILQPGEIGYAGSSGFGSYEIKLSSLDQVASVDANIKFDVVNKDVPSTNLDISGLQIVPEPSTYGPGKARVDVTATNPSSKDAEYFHVIVGLFNAQDQLIGTAYCQDNPLIAANGGKTILQCVSGWKGMDKWDTVTKLDGRGYVERYVD